MLRWFAGKIATFHKYSLGASELDSKARPQHPFFTLGCEDAFSDSWSESPRKFEK